MPLSVGLKENESGFDPRSIPGCITWLDASDPKVLLSASPASSGTPVGSNGSVNFWFDKSAASNHLTVGTAGSPVRIISYSNNLDAVRFQGNYMDANSSSGNYPIDVYVIVSLSNIAHAWDVCTVGSISNGSFNSLTFGEFLSNNWHNGSDYFNRTSNAVSSNTESSIGLLLMEWSIADSNYIIRRNGTVIMQNSVYTYSLIQQSIFSVGRRNPNQSGGDGNNLYGHIGEIVAFNTQLTSTDRTKIEGYLTHKWRLKTDLPTTHPYRYNFPFTRPFNPLDVGICLLWLDGADQRCNSMTISSGNITEWFDKSGNGGNTTTVSTSRPTTTTINGVPAVQFTTGNGASEKWFIGDWGGKVYNPTGITAFVVATENAGNSISYPRLFQIGSNDGTHFHMSLICGNQGSGKPGIISYNNALTLCNFFTTNIANQIQLPALDTPFIFMNRVTTLVSNYYLSELGLNGTSLCPLSNTSGNGYTSNLNTYSIGGYLSNTMSGIGDNWFGKIGEIILYSNVLTIQQQQQVEGYLSKKWGISMSPCNTVPCNFNCNALWLDFADTTSLTLSGTNISSISNKGVFGGSFTNIGVSAAACNAFSQNGLVTAQILQSNSFSNDITLPNQSRVIFIAMKASYSNTPTSGNWYTNFHFGSYDGGADQSFFSYQSNMPDVGTGFILGHIAAGSNVNTAAFLPSAINPSGAFNIFTYAVSSNTSLNRVAINGVSYYLNSANMAASTYSTGSVSHLLPIHDNSYTTYVDPDYTYVSNVSVWTINLGEYLLFNGELSRNQVSQIENYLMAKWAVTPCNVGSGIQSTYRIPSMSTQPFSPACVSNLSLWLDANDHF